jgi:hexulose-6-phosphate isomerase
VRDKSLEGVAASIETAAALGTNVVLIVPAVVSPDVTYEQAMKRSKESIRRILPLCKKKKVLLGVENVWNRFLLSPVEFADYVDSFDSEFVAAYFDVGNIVAYGFPDHWIRTLGRRIERIHVKGFHAGKHEFVQLRDGTIDWPRVVAALKATGYNGYVTAELGPGGPHPLKGFRKISRDMDTARSLVQYPG